MLHIKTPCRTAGLISRGLIVTGTLLTAAPASATLMKMVIDGDFNVVHGAVNNLTTNSHTNKLTTDAFGKSFANILDEAVWFSVIYDDALTERTTQQCGPAGCSNVSMYAYNDIRSFEFQLGNLLFSVDTHPSDPLGSIDLGSRQALTFVNGTPDFNFFFGTPKQGSRKLLVQPDGHRVDAATYYWNTLDRGYTPGVTQVAFIPYLGDSLDTLAGRVPGDATPYLSLNGRLSNLQLRSNEVYVANGGGSNNPSNAVPEPTALALFGLGLGLMVWTARRKY